MKAISVRQPWASLIAIGRKRLETRTWKTEYRGPVAIHASKSFPGSAKDDCERGRISKALKRAGLMPEGLPRGQIIAIAWLEDCITAKQAKKLIAAGRFSSDELAFGDLSRGRHVFILSRIRRLRKPFPATGSLSLWNWPGE